MKHRMQQSLNDLEMHGKNTLCCWQSRHRLTKAEAPAGPEDLCSKKARTGKLKGTAGPHMCYKKKNKKQKTTFTALSCSKLTGKVENIVYFLFMKVRKGILQILKQPCFFF